MTVDVKLPDVVGSTCRVPGAGGCRNEAHWGKSAGELPTVAVAAADAVDSVGVTRPGCSEHTDRIPRRGCGRQGTATTLPPNACARRQTTSSDDTRAVCELVGIGDAQYAGNAPGADANHTGRVTRAALSIDANRIGRAEW